MDLVDLELKLKNLTLDELRVLARELKIVNYSSLNKGDLVNLLLKHAEIVDKKINSTWWEKNRYGIEFSTTAVGTAAGLLGLYLALKTDSDEKAKESILSPELLGDFAKYLILRCEKEIDEEKDTNASKEINEAISILEYLVIQIKMESLELDLARAYQLRAIISLRQKQRENGRTDLELSISCYNKVTGHISESDNLYRFKAESDLAHVYILLYQGSKDPEASFDLINKAVDLLQKLIAENPLPELQKTLGIALTGRTILHKICEDNKLDESDIDRALTLLSNAQQVFASEDFRAELFYLYLFKGGLCKNQARFDLAVKNYINCLNIAESIIKDEKRFLFSKTLANFFADQESKDTFKQTIKGAVNSLVHSCLLMETKLPEPWDYHTAISFTTLVIENCNKFINYLKDDEINDLLARLLLTRTSDYIKAKNLKNAVSDVERAMTLAKKPRTVLAARLYYKTIQNQLK